MKRAILIALASGLATVAIMRVTPALGQQAPHSTAQVQLVHTGDLDLSSTSGRRRLDHRLVNAVRQVCGDASAADLAGANIVRQCRTDALAAARSRRDALLTANGTGKQIAVMAAR